MNDARWGALVRSAVERYELGPKLLVYLEALHGYDRGANVSAPLLAAQYQVSRATAYRICRQAKRDVAPPVPNPARLRPITPGSGRPLPAGGATYPPDFELWWREYPRPRRRGKGDALKAWRQLKPDKATVAKMIEALGWQSRSWDWRKSGGQFIPMPATWLRQRRWEDEPPEEETAAVPEQERLPTVLVMLLRREKEQGRPWQDIARAAELPETQIGELEGILHAWRQAHGTDG